VSRRSRNRRSYSNLHQPAASDAAKAAASAATGESGLLAGYSLILAFVTFVLYFPVTHHPFLYFDDEKYIFENPFVRSGLTTQTIKWAFVSFDAANWHPLTWLAHAFNVQLFGLDPGGHHLASLLLHVANVILFFLVLNFIFRAPERCFFAAALFALHPQNVESVAWAAELKNLLCTFFFFTTIAAYLYYSRKPSVSRYTIVAVSFALGLAAKPMIVTLPFVLALLDYWPFGRVQRLTEPSESPLIPQRSILNLALEKLPLLFLSGVSSWITLLAQTRGEATTMIHPTFYLRFANATVAYATYLLKMFVPADLAPLYPFPLHGIPAWKVLLSSVLLLGISGAVLVYGRLHPYLLVGWLWFLSTLVPVIGLLQVGVQSRADRYMYIPMIGIILMIVWGFSELADHYKWTSLTRRAPAVLIFLVLFAITSRQIAYWDTSFSLWQHAIDVTGDNAVAEHNLSIELFRVGRNSEAFPHSIRAVSLEPSDWASHNNLGVYYLSQGKRAEALQEFNLVIRSAKDPKLVVAAMIDLGSTYSMLGELDKADAAYRGALTLSPNNAAALAGLNGLARARAASPLNSPKN